MPLSPAPSLLMVAPRCTRVTPSCSSQLAEACCGGRLLGCATVGASTEPSCRPQLTIAPRSCCARRSEFTVSAKREILRCIPPRAKAPRGGLPAGSSICCQPRSRCSGGTCSCCCGCGDCSSGCSCSPSHHGRTVCCVCCCTGACRGAGSAFNQRPLRRRRSAMRRSMPACTQSDDNGNQ
jgi:hypothetical protein